MVMLWFIGGIVVVAIAVGILLASITRKGGESSGDAASIAGLVPDQTSALRSGSSNQPRDGVDLLETGPGDPGFF